MKLLEQLYILIIIPVKLIAYLTGYVFGFIHAKTKRLFANRNSPFPKTIKDFWYCGMWYKSNSFYMFEFDKTICFNPFTTGLLKPGTKDGLIDGLIPAVRMGGLVGLYRVAGFGKASHYRGDLASWDNGETVDLVFVKSINLLEAEKIIFDNQPNCVEEVIDPERLNAIIKKIQDANPNTAQLVTPEKVKVEIHRHLEHIVKISSKEGSGFSGSIFFCMR